LDHVLFLLVVVAAGLRWQKMVTVLTVFTLGHAISLTVIVLGGVTAPSRVVEPAIAATITALALYDLWADKLGTSASAWRLGLVFCCSVIHGLGLGNALAVLGLDPAHQGATLFGFNLGIELGQLCIATVATVVLMILQTVLAAPRVRLLHTAMRLTAVIIGMGWIVQRVLFA
jgi:HupE / UreJ protein